MSRPVVTREPSILGATFSIGHKHIRKFLGNGEELFGVMIQPVLWVVLFGVGMRSMVGGANAGSNDGDAPKQTNRTDNHDTTTSRTGGVPSAGPITAIRSSALRRPWRAPRS